MSKDNNVLLLPSVETIEEEASTWLVVFGRESVSDQEKTDFEYWLWSFWSLYLLGNIQLFSQNLLGCLIFLLFNDFL